MSPVDIGAAFVARFTRASAAESEAWLARWRAGELGHRELTIAECRQISVSESEALEFTRGFALDPGFARFADEAAARGETVEVVSEGLDFYVGDQLQRAGLAQIPWSANRARFDGRTLELEFPLAEAGCGRCGNCKGVHVRRRRASGFEVVLVGDGFSDRCGALAADRVFARGELLEWCGAQEIAATAFEDFAEVAELARALAIGEQASRNGAVRGATEPRAPGSATRGGSERAGR